MKKYGLGITSLVVLLIVLYFIPSSRNIRDYPTGSLKAETTSTVFLGSRRMKPPNVTFNLVDGKNASNPVEVKATVPVNPKAERIAGEIPNGGGGRPMVDHLYTAKQSYIIHEDREKAEASTEQLFIHNGLIKNGFGYIGTTNEPHLTDTFTFGFQDDYDFSISVSFVKQNKDTLMEYSLTYVYVPPRDYASEVPLNVTKIILSLGKPDGKLQKTEITDMKTISSILEKFNRLPVHSGGIGGCTRDDGTRLTMEFILTNGKSLLAVEDPACSSIVLGQKSVLYDRSWTFFEYVRKSFP